MRNSLDLSYLEEITGGDVEVIIEMITLFLDETPAQLELLKEKAANKDWDSVAAGAHRVRPTFLYVGSLELHKKTSDVERLSKKRERLNLISGYIDSLEKGFNEIKGSLTNKKKELEEAKSL